MAKTSFVKPKAGVPAKSIPAKLAAKLVVPTARPVVKSAVPTPRAVAPVVKPAPRPIAPAPRAIAQPPRPAPRATPAPRPISKVVAPEPEPEQTQEPEDVPPTPAEAMEETGDELAQNASHALAVSEPGQVSGEVDASDFELPDLKLAQSVGPLTEDLGFTPGQLVLKKEMAIWSPEESDPISITVLKVRKQFIENLDYGSDVMPRIFDTLQQVKDEGGHIEWIGSEPPPFVPLATALILIRKPDDLKDTAGAFNLEHESGLYTQAIWRLQGQSYKYAARKIITESRLRLKEGLFLGSFDLLPIKVKGKMNSYWVPQLKNGPMHDQSFVDFALAANAG